MTIHRHARMGLAALLACGLGACDAATGPEAGRELDTEAVLADYEAFADAVDSDGLRAFAALAGRTSAAASAPAGGPSAAPLVSDFNRGVTFVYDPGLDRYARGNRDGAPDTGVRFVLYDTDGSGRPDPDREIGYADFVDEGDGSAEDVVLHLSVVVRGTLLLDYRTTLDDTGTGGAVTVEGFLVGDHDRLDFAIDAASSSRGGTHAVDLGFEMRIDTRDFAIVGTVSGAEHGASGEGDVDLTVRHGPHSFRVDVSGRSDRLDGSIYLDGGLFCTVSGDADHPTFEGAGGDALTGAELLVVRHVVDSSEDVFDLLEDLLDPVDELLVLGIVL